MDHFERKIVFQPTFFRGHVSFRGRTSVVIVFLKFSMLHHSSLHTSFNTCFISIDFELIPNQQLFFVCYEVNAVMDMGLEARALDPLKKPHTLQQMARRTMMLTSSSMVLAKSYERNWRRTLEWHLGP